MSEQTHLKRSLSLPMLVLYGLGTTVGAGIYALIGELAALSAFLAPLAFLLAALMASLIAMSFAELSGRFPRAAGAALYVQEGFNSTSFATITGLAVVLAGVVSAAALLNGFVGYFHQFLDYDRVYVIIIAAVVLSIIAAWGIAESVTVAGIITVVEIGGLLLVVFVSRDALGTLPAEWDKLVPSMSLADGKAVLAGALLAFYAFIGFEDMVDVAEEVKDVRRTLPLAIIVTLFVTTILYLLVMTTAVLGLPMEELVQSKAPLATLYERSSGEAATLISFIGMFAIINGALIQIIMASRVLYGLSSRGQLPAFFSRVNTRTQTPILATLFSTALVLLLALLGRLASLAQATSIIMLLVFAFISLALWRIKRQQSSPTDSVIVPSWVPLLACLVSLLVVGWKIFSFV